MSELALKLLIVLPIAPLIFLFTRTLYKRNGWRRVIVLMLAAFFTFVTIFYFDEPGLWTGPNIIEAVGSQKNDPAAVRFIDDNFLLIDNSFDKKLIPYENGDEEDSSVEVVTNQSILARLLSVAASDSGLIDLVVLDVGLPPIEKIDSSLKRQLIELHAENKIILSVDPRQTWQKDLIADPNIYGNISEKGNRLLFSTHKIVNDGLVSLPYRVYTFMEGRQIKKLDQTTLSFETDANGNDQLFTNSFFPDFHITDENDLLNPGRNPAYRNYYLLSQPLSKTGKTEFVQNLKKRKHNGKKNILFIGSFKSQYEDTHATYYTSDHFLHGPVILLNILYSLHQGRHHLSVGLVILLFLGYWFILAILISRCWKLPFLPGKTRTQAKKAAIVSRPVHFHFFRFLLEFLFLEELAFVLLLVLAWVIWLLEHRIVNIWVLLIYLGVIKASLSFAHDKIIRNDKKE